MNSILESLYMCSTKDGEYLTQDELRDYYSNVQLEEQLEEQLEHLLEGKSLQLFQQYVEASKNAMLFGDSSTFRNGLTIGLKLGLFCALDG